MATVKGVLPASKAITISTGRASRLLSWALFAVAMGVACAALIVNLLVESHKGDGQQGLGAHFLIGLTSPVTTLAYAVIGLLVSARRPGSVFGWLFGGLGVAMGLVAYVAVYVRLESATTGALPLQDVASWLDLWLWLPVVIVPHTWLLLLYPDGNLPSSRWRPVSWAAGAGLLLAVSSIALHPEPNVAPDQQYNPYGLAGAGPFLDASAWVGGLLLAAALVGSLAAPFVRMHRARDLERRQLKWLVWCLVTGVLFVLTSSVWALKYPEHPFARQTSVGGIWVGLTLLGLGAGIGIVRFRRSDIDLLVSRTLVYGSMSAGVVGVYVALAAAFGALLGSTGGLPLAALAAAVGAALLEPLRTRLQRAVNRWLYGARDDPYTVLSSLSQQMRFSSQPSDVLMKSVETIGTTLRLPWVALTVPGRMDDATLGGAETVAEYGRQAGDPVPFPLIHQGERVGTLLIAPRLPGEAFSTAEKRLLEDIALQAGAAVHLARLHSDLLKSREQLVATREEERRRLRRDLHDGLGPHLASLTLTAAAVRELLPTHPAAADSLLGELAVHAQNAVADVRRVVYGLRPPALDDLGLASALREHAARCSRRALQITVEAPQTLPELPAAIEVAAYHIAHEAITNVVNHAQARRCVVELTLGDALTLEVIDDGIGFAQQGRTGVGLYSMRERAAEVGGRWAIESALGRGTRIRVELPLNPEAV